MTEPIKFSNIEPADADEFITPNHKADDKPAAPLFGKPAITGKWSRSAQKAKKDDGKLPPFVDPPEPVPNKPGQFVKPLEEMYQGFAMIVMPFAPHIAQTVAMNARKCAEAWDEWAQQNEAIRRSLKRLLSTNAMAQVVMAHMPILMAIALSIPAVQSLFGSMLGKEAEAHANRPPADEGTTEYGGFEQ